MRLQQRLSHILNKGVQVTNKCVACDYVICQLSIL